MRLAIVSKMMRQKGPRPRNRRGLSWNLGAGRFVVDRLWPIMVLALSGHRIVPLFEGIDWDARHGALPKDVSDIEKCKVDICLGKQANRPNRRLIRRHRP